MKRLFDFTIALAAAAVTLPIVAAAALVVWLWDFRNPIYVSLRVRDPKSTFPMYKFRSMVPGADLRGGASTPGNDARLTPVGRIIRALKIDELPQLWNVLIGDMSLVGPRAQVVQGAVLYTAEENRLFDVRPGITDFASIVFADEGRILAAYPDPDDAYDKVIRPWKSRLGLEYVTHPRLWIDVALIGLTLVAIVSKPAARKGVQFILRRLGSPDTLIRVAGRIEPLAHGVPPGGITAAENGPYLPLSLHERASWGGGLDSLRRGPIIAIHLVLAIASNTAAWLLRFDGSLGAEQLTLLQEALPWLLLIRGVLFTPFRLYQGLWRYTGVYDLQAVIVGVLTSSIAFASVAAFAFPGYPLAVIIIDALVLTFLLGGVRLSRRMYSEFGSWAPGTRDVLIFGAGDVGERLARAMRANRSGGRRPIGFIDDDAAKVGLRIHSVPVLGGHIHLASILAKTSAHEVIVATRNGEAPLRDVTDILDARGIEVRGAAEFLSHAHPRTDSPSFTPVPATAAPSEAAAEEADVVDGLLTETCPRCARQAYRSHARSTFERARKGWSVKRLYRCHACGWRGWLLPIDQYTGNGDLQPGPVDLSDLDASLPSAEAPSVMVPRDS